ncbi:MAG TPA: NAD(P)/FAD-dependent oxidoreductase [Candidatus Binatia bacterium]|nr:NAD(P)/FAD-dependent oxidoreductase [Candidatus Binatia bacterium]
MTAYDLVVIGTGSSGNAVATTCARAGRRVAIVDELPYGGTCELRGCDPKKVLVGAAELIDWCDRMRGSGFSGEARIDWPELMRFKRTFTDPVPQQREESYSALGIETYHGQARFVDPATISVGDRRLETRHVVLATGARPANLQIAGEEHLITSTDFLDLERMPRRVAFIGGGYIAFEFAHLAVRAGAAPVILQRGPRVLTGFDPGLVDALVDVSGAVGIDVRVQCEVHAAEKIAAGFVVSGIAGGEEFSLECDLVVHAAGRIPDLDDLDLAAGNVQRTDKGVAVNEFLQSRSNAAVYAVGDCADGGGLPLTPTASVEGEVAARNLLEGNRHSVDFAGLVSIVYTIPPLGSTGLTQAAADERGLRCTVGAADSTQWYSSRRIHARRSAFRVIVEDSTGRILGAHVLGPHAEELLNVFSLAIRAQIPAATLGGALFAYPTASSDIAGMLQGSK